MSCFMKASGIVAWALVVSVSFVGCSQSKPTSAPVTTTPANTAATSSPSEEAKPAAKSKETQIAEALAQLSDADRQIAESQKTCPVSDQALGSMGAPIKVDVNGRDVFVCCNGCTEALKSDAEKYLAKLPASSPTK